MANHNLPKQTKKTVTITKPKEQHYIKTMRLAIEGNIAIVGNIAGQVNQPSSPTLIELKSTFKKLLSRDPGFSFDKKDLQSVSPTFFLPGEKNSRGTSNSDV